MNCVFLLAGLLTLAPGGLTLDEQAPAKSVATIQATHDRALVRDLLAYLAENPKATDAEQAYREVFDKVIEHDWFAEHEAVARKYLDEKSEGSARSLAGIIVTMGRAEAGKFAEALASYQQLMNGLGGSDQEEFAVNFADTLATAATAAGEVEVTRKIYDTLLKKFGAESPNLAQRVKDELTRLERVGQLAPLLTIKDLNGKPLRLDEYRGKYVLVEFWATWCEPYVVEIPRLIATREKYGPKGFEIVAISLDETRSAVSDFVRDRKIPWRVVHNGSSDGDLVEAFGVRVIPSTFLIDPTGKIVRLELRGPALNKALESLIK